MKYNNNWINLFSWRGKNESNLGVWSWITEYQAGNLTQKQADYFIGIYFRDLKDI